jgi:hypothetical protein
VFFIPVNLQRTRKVDEFFGERVEVEQWEGMEKRKKPAESYSLPVIDFQKWKKKMVLRPG